MTRELLIEAGYGGRLDLREGELLEVVNVEGQQICDFFAFNANDVKEFLSPAHCRATLRRVTLGVDDKLVSVYRRPMIEIVQDTSDGVHDICFPSCDRQRYLLGFGIPDHRNCRANLAEAVADFGIPYEYLPDPINFFQNTPIRSDGSFETGTSPARPGDKIVLRALMNLIVVGSACPHDIYPTNGERITDVKLVVRND